MPERWYAVAVGCTVFVALLALYLVGAHHEFAYWRRQRRRKRVDITDARVRT